MHQPRPFRPFVEPQQLADLQARLSATRYPRPLPGAPSGSRGFDQRLLKETLEAWKDFDWRAAEARLADAPSYLLEVDGRDVHILHRRSSNPKALPLVLTHGWPSSVFELMPLLGPLCEPTGDGAQRDDAFHVVAISMPGYGFSAPPSKPGFDIEAVARTMARVMDQLGYDHYVATGGDWGAMAATRLAQLEPTKLLALHLSMVLVSKPEGWTEADYTETEKPAIEAIRAYMRTGTAYQAAQALEPDTVGAALDDSPAGLAAWILSKFLQWSDDRDGTRPDLFDRFSRDDLLANLSLYWFTRSATTAARLYFESAQAGTFGPHKGYIEVPTAVAVFPRELFRPPRRWVERAFNLRRWTLMDQGGHFASLEATDSLVADLREFFRPFREH